MLSAIWGASFLFTRISAPILGPTLLIEYRVTLAAVFLLLVSFFIRQKLDFKSHWKYYFILGSVNAALPFLLFAYASQTLTASLLSILNATAPIWGAIVRAIWTKSTLSRKSVLGLVMGVVGVAILVGFDTTMLVPNAGLAVVAVLCATLSYGIATTYAHEVRTVRPFSNAHGSMWAASFLILPLVPFFPANETPTTDITLAVIALGVVCTGFAFHMFFRLLGEIGAPSTLTVTFLIPLFGVLWGHIFLDEIVGWHTAIGSVVVITGTALVTGFSPTQLLKRAKRLP